MRWFTFIAVACIAAVAGGLMLRLGAGASTLPADKPPSDAFRPRINRRFWACISAALGLHLA
ncbi:MAG: hypothetical protein ACHRHE_19160, partial [Tepidisphaerales bacterium]